MNKKSNKREVSAKSARKGTLKQQKFAMHLIGAARGNQTLAAQMAGYKGDKGQLAVQGSINMRNPAVQERIAELLEAAGCSGELVAQRLREGLDSTKRRAFATKEGRVFYSAPEPDFRERRQYAQLVLDCRSKVASGSRTPSTATTDIPSREEAILEAEELLFEELPKQELASFIARMQEKLANLPDRAQQDGCQAANEQVPEPTPLPSSPNGTKKVESQS